MNETTQEIYKFGEAINRIDAIKNEIHDLVNEAANIVRTKVGRRDLIYQRAEVYWIPRIKTSLESDEEYGTIDSTIADMEYILIEMKKE